TLRILKKLFQKDHFMGFRPTVWGGECFGLQSSEGLFSKVPPMTPRGICVFLTLIAEKNKKVLYLYTKSS
ncbi:MAG: hypothetical protein IJW40_05475, partial [Clostridia bacterium]|nr:hypothetical protein [Clostridia bacterium]